jgi:enamine deaminase RidA (YjgF/YER057c/UK114 family)
MNNRTNLSSGAKWEDIVGYSRAVKIGNVIEVSGTTSVDEESNIIGLDNPYEQTVYILKKIEKSLIKLGATIDNVIRTRIYVCNINQWEEIGKAHCEFFSTIRPVTSMVEVSRLIDPRLLVEIEVSAII